MRTNPVARESVVALDIVNVERAIDGLLMAFLRVVPKGRNRCPKTAV